MKKVRKKGRKNRCLLVGNFVSRSQVRRYFRKNSGGHLLVRGNCKEGSREVQARRVHRGRTCDVQRVQK